MSDDTVILRDILSTLREIRDSLRSGGASSGAGAHAAPSGTVASDSDLDGPYGDPAVRKDPPRWNTAADGSYVGCKLSECPPEYLEALAGFFDWQAGKDEASGKKSGGGTGKPTAPYKRKDAARCRGWIIRKRNGWKPDGAQPEGSRPERETDSADNFGGADAAVDDIPFIFCDAGRMEGERWWSWLNEDVL